MKRKSKEKSFFKEVIEHPFTKVFGGLLLGLAGLALGRKIISG